ncbi:hypothetical protein [Marinobacter similis]|uniref:hypothetical protein n=1 Tax=Marinobacter similis TaxID=1420916 RepID=UPI000AB4BD23|nr:hypothetical protein [Marinobacter similis]
MTDQAGSIRNKFRSHVIIELALIAALALYMVLAQEKPVGEDLIFTVVGAGLMALVTYWTLNTSGWSGSHRSARQRRSPLTTRFFGVYQYQALAIRHQT